MKFPKNLVATPLLLALGTLAIALTGSSVASGQGPTTVDDQTATGDRPFAAFLSSNIDQVQLGSGALGVHIQLFDLKGRGLAHTKYWTYSNKTWFVQSFDLNPPDPPTPMWTWFNPVAPFSPSEIAHTSDMVTCGGETFQVLHHWIYTDEYGTNHEFDALKTMGHHCYVDRLIGYALDASGMTIDLTNFLSTGYAIVRLIDGTQVTAITVLRKDTNGNNITATSASDGEVDTLGRKETFARGTLPDGALYQDWTVKDSSGTSRTTRLELIFLQICTNFNNYPTLDSCGTAGPQRVRKIDLPNGQSYQFTYDTGATPGHYGDLTRIDLPSGGYIRYEYTTLAGGDHSSRAVTKRAASPDGNPANEEVWIYQYTSDSDGTVSTTLLTAPQGNQSLHSFVGSGLESQAQYYQGAMSSSVLLRTVKTDHACTGYSIQSLDTYPDPNSPSAGVDCRPIRVTTILDNTLTSKLEMDYDAAPDSNGPIAFSRSNASERREYAYGSGAPGALVRRTTYTYLHDTNANYAARNVVDRLSSQTVYDSSSNTCNGQAKPCAQTNFYYDTTPITTTSGVVQHDYSGYPSTMTIRGNLTEIDRWRNTDGTFLATKNWYDDLGNVVQTQDPLLHTTSFDYSESWTTATGGSTCAPASGSTRAFVAKTTNSLLQTSSAKFYSCSSLIASVTDPNSQTTSYAYDLFRRPLTETRPDGGTTTWTYNDTALIVTRAVAIGNGVSPRTTQSLFDGLGRVKQAQLTSDPQGTDFTDTTYDALGCVATVSNPYRSTSDPTYGISTTQYDALSRLTKIIPPDGTASANNVTTAYTGNCTTATDQAGKTRKSCSDVLGRLTQLFEDPVGLNYETDYAYDALNNLLTVSQKGGSTNSANWRTRTFTYNSLSQLLTATNPESGTTTYSYDNDGNVQTKVAPAPNQTGSATVTTTFAYDQLHRVTQKSFSDSTPVVKYGYDAVSPSGCTPPALTIANGIGRHTSLCDAAGSEAWSYDSMGRPLTDARATNSVTKSTAYTYNLDGSLATLTYASGRTISYGYNAAARPLSAVDTANSINYATAAAYAPTGALASLTNGASILSTSYYNNRLQPCRISVKNSGTAPASCTDVVNVGNVLDFNYNFSVATANNGNVTAITNNRDTARSQSFTYDALNRLATAQTNATFATGSTKCWSEQFSYDPWANFLSITGSGSPYTGCTQEGLNTTATTKNQISGFCYDAAGNLLAQSAPPCPSPTYTYNAENQMTLTAGVTYIYDGDGKRVQKSNGKLYWYGMASDPITETDLAGNNPDEYVFFGGKRIARRKSTGEINYYFADHLGTSRVVASATGGILDDSDYYPFGGERAILSSSGNNYKFTGKERDSESGLDYFGARHMGSSLGRFMSVDPSSVSIDKFNPQSWNRYSYTYNNPLKYVDQNGKWPTLTHELIYKNAFPGLSQQQLDQIKAASAYVDRIPGGQTKAHNHEHAMKSPGEDPATAKRAIDQNIQNHEQAAQKAQGGTPEHAADIKPAALNEFGQVAHTVSDRDSPAHTDAQGNPRDWNGLPTSKQEWNDVQQHRLEEAIISPEEMERSIQDLRDAFEATFGSAALQEAITPRPPLPPSKEGKDEAPPAQ
jgi:RHS repeat-associated protein